MKRIKAFTLIELLLTVSLLAILFMIVISDINPARQLKTGRDVQRESDINLILSVVLKYELDTGNIPATITGTSTEICKTDAVSCAGLIDLSVLTQFEDYLSTIPVDPSGASSNGTGYYIFDDGSKTYIDAPYSELSVVSVSR